MTNLVWIDNKIIDSKEVNLSIFTHALHYATSVFEGIRVYNNKLFKLEEHIDRLLNSANLINLKTTHASQTITNACNKLIELNQLEFGYVRPIIFRGEGSLKLGAENKIHIAILTQKINSTVENVKLMVSKWKKPPIEVFPPECKGASNYAIAAVAKYEAIQNGYDDALMLDINNYVAEATTSNIFWVKNNIVFTPPPKYILNGITRQFIIEIIKELGLEMIEKFCIIDELLESEEIFLTGTTIEICSVTKLDNKQFTQNNITTRIKQYFYNKLQCKTKTLIL